MKLSELDPNDIVQPAQPKALRLSDLNPDDVHHVVSSKSHDDSVVDIPGKIRDKLLESVPLLGGDNLKDAATGAEEGLSLGFRNELSGALKGGAKTALEAAGLEGEIPKGKSAMQQLVDNYYKYSKKAQDEQKDAHARSPYLAGGAELASSFVPGGAVLKGLGAAGKVAAGIGLGGAMGLGNSENTLKDNPVGLGVDAAKSAALGGAIVPVAEHVIAPVVNKIGNHLVDNPFAKKMAAAVLNKAEGRGLFGQEAQSATKNYLANAEKNITKQITSPVDEINSLYPEIYGKASEAGVKVNPTMGTSDPMEAFAQIGKANPLEDATSQLANSNKVPRDIKALLAKVVGGNASPSETNELLKSIKQLKSGNFADAELGNSVSEAYKPISQALDEATPEIQNQNLRDRGTLARSVSDPFANGKKLITDPDFMPKGYSDFGSMADANKDVGGHVNRLINKAGENKTGGIDARQELSDYSKYLQSLQGDNAANNLGINIPTNAPADIQKLAYLRSAQRAVTGDTEMGAASYGKVIDSLFNKVLQSPYKLAEIGAKSSSVQDISRKILSGSPMESQQAIQVLSQNPETRQLAQRLHEATQSGDSSKLTNSLFQIMQNPAAKSQLGIHDENTTPTVKYGETK